MDVRHRLIGAIIALVVFGTTAVASYAILDHFYGTARVYAPRLENIIWENTGESLYGEYTWQASLLISPNYQSAPPGDTLIYAVTVKNVGNYVDNYSLQVLDDAGWSVGVSNDSVQVEGGSYENVRLTVGIPENSEYGENDRIVVVAISGKSPEMGAGTLCYARSGEYFAADVPIPPGAGAGLQPVITYEKPVAVIPIAASIGIGMGLIVLGVWVGYRRVWGDATSTLVDHGLQDMTVRDVEIVGEIIEMKEFTIPELMGRTHTSKLRVWRIIQKLYQRGIIKSTEKTKPAAGGLGGRGKPSRIYRYIGVKEKGDNEKS